jgi:hypothetical protein
MAAIGHRMAEEGAESRVDTSIRRRPYDAEVTEVQVQM